MEPSAGALSGRPVLSRRSLLGGLGGLAAAGLARPAFAAPPPEFALPQASELAKEGMERLAPDFWVAQLAEGIWITSFTALIGGWVWYPANGLIVADGDRSILVDPGWSRPQGHILLDFARDRLKRPARSSVVTHFHTDRTGGIAALRRAGIPAFAAPLSVDLAQRYGAPVPDPVPGFRNRLARVGPLEIFFPGAGHSPDNVVVWHEASRTLFGGCLLKAVTAGDIGKVEDADLAAYGQTLRRLAKRYPRPSHVVPGHGALGGDVIAHTAALAEKARRSMTK